MANRSRIKSNVFVYVAGLDRGVRPIGDWSMLITLSTFSIPSIRVWAPARTRVPCSRDVSAR